MGRHERGLYELLITEALAADLQHLENHLEPKATELHEAEAADRFALHLSRVLATALSSIDRSRRVAVGSTLITQLVDSIVEATSATQLSAERPLEPAQMLRSILARLPDGRPEAIRDPHIPLLDTTLLTNAPDEPRVGHQIEAEIHSADRIDVVMAFVRRTGIRPMLDALRAHCQAGRKLRVLTTTYTGSTEAAALDDLIQLGADVRVSYDIGTTRLHAKAWLFHRSSGFSTAYIGSSNLTHSAQINGLEWNVRLSSARNAPVIEKVAAVFESYWANQNFVAYERNQFLAQTSAANADSPGIFLSPLEVRPEPFQARLLEQIALARQQGHHRNLLVSATGTGKTVMAALDYATLRETLPRARLLFVAHREEILTKTRATFGHALREPSFGELWVAGRRPDRFEHVFASIQSLAAAGRDSLDPAHFDVVIIDEFHHAAAKTYADLLNHVRPVELLGLTATPERSDGLPLLDWFDGRIAAELRLWDAIDQHRLVPFAYYGVHDGLDLREVPWRRGRGYDGEGLSNLYTSNDVWARLVIAQVLKHASDPTRLRALGFCVSVEHARFMARLFEVAGIRAVAIWADTPADERRQALVDLGNRKVNVVFSVDLFNEGVDVPSVDLLLILRPTDSATLFLQQLGRGLRRSPGKSICTVLDFVGHHRAEFRFDRRLGAILKGTRAEIEQQVRGGFPFLPAGCHMELDAVASEIVIASIRNAVPSTWRAKAEELRRFAATSKAADRTVSLSGFMQAADLEPDDVYSGDRGWSDLLQAAGVAVDAEGSDEQALRRACSRLRHVDDAARIDAYRRLTAPGGAPPFRSLSALERRYARMLVASVVESAVSKSATLEEGYELLAKHPQVRAEVHELLGVLAERVQHKTYPLDAHRGVPLFVGARYTRIEILAAFGIGEGAKVAPWQTGVYWAKEAKADLLAFTLDKTSGQFSPTTRYRDYAVSRDLNHWESQSVTREDSETGQRYQHHAKRGSSVMLFARHRSTDRASYFLGPAKYVKHEGELPMAVTWRLAFELPGDLFASFAAAVA